MDKNKRRAFYIGLTAVFLVLAPFILFYAYGYRFNFSEKRVVKTGLLILNTEPRGADVYLNNRFLKKRTPARITNLYPKEYFVQLKKTGYRTWEKKLNILTDITTFADDIILFLRKPKIQNLISDNIKLSAISSNKQKVALVIKKTGKEQIILTDLNKRTNLISTDLKSEAEKISWRENKLVVKTKDNQKTDYLIIDKNNKITYLSEITILNFNKLLGGDNEIFYGLSGDVIYKIDLFQKKVESVSDRPTKDFMVVENSLYYLNQTESNMELIKINLADHTQISLGTFGNNDYRFFPIDKNKFILADENSFTIFQDEDSLKKTEYRKEIINLSFLADKKQILFYNNHEIWIHDFEEEKQDLIIRIGKTIDFADFYPGGNYIIYGVENSINIIELDKRDVQNNYRVYKYSGEIQNIIALKKDLFFIIKNDQNLKDGLYRLTIR